MKFLVDMNLSPKWCASLAAEGWDCVHWSEVGQAAAADEEIIEFALNQRRVVLTHDLDIAAILALTKATGPSVIQIRTQDVRPQTLAPKLIPLLRCYENELDAGAVLIVDEAKSRIRLLPLPQKPRWQQGENRTSSRARPAFQIQEVRGLPGIRRTRCSERIWRVAETHVRHAGVYTRDELHERR